MAAARYANEPCLGTRTGGHDGTPGGYEWISYGAAAAETAAIGAGLLRHGVKQGDKVGIYSVNCAEWLLTEAAIARQACVSVPLYDTLGALRCSCARCARPRGAEAPPPQARMPCSSSATTRS